MLLPLILVPALVQASEPPVMQLERGVRFEGFVWIKEKLFIVVSVLKPNGKLFLLVDPNGGVVLAVLEPRSDT